MKRRSKQLSFLWFSSWGFVVQVHTLHDNSPPFRQKLILLSEDCLPERLLNDQQITTYQVLTRSSPLQQPVRRNVDATREVAMLLLSSGTTGLSKGVQLSHYNLIVHILTFSKFGYLFVLFRFMIYRFSL